MITYTQLGNQETYLTIHADGKITVSDKLKPDETAARVLECMKTQWMDDSQSKQIRELQASIKRLEDSYAAKDKQLSNLLHICRDNDIEVSSYDLIHGKEAKP